MLKTVRSRSAQPGLPFSQQKQADNLDRNDGVVIGEEPDPGFHKAKVYGGVPQGCLHFAGQNVKPLGNSHSQLCNSQSI